MLGSLTGKLPLDRDQLRARLQRVRHDAFVARTEGAARLFTLSADGLTRAQDLLDSVPGPVAQPLRRVVGSGLDQVTRLPIADYDALNVKKVGDAVRGLSLIDLERVARYERAHKDRKTVFRHIERERERLLREPVAA